MAKYNASTGANMTTRSMDGSVNSMTFDARHNVIVHTLLQNGTASSPSFGTTQSNVIAYNNASAPSYTTSAMLNLTTGVTRPSSTMIDNSPFGSSSISSALAYPAQNAASPPIYVAPSGDFTATVTGNSFTVSDITTGDVLVQGTVPHPIRSVALSPTMLYFTMAESNSLVTVPLVIP